jgi:spore germination cell wall hydrolase CwlJ-like protein
LKSKAITVLILSLISFFMFSSYVSGAYLKTEQDISRVVAEEYNKELECLTKNIYYEAGVESYEGKLAVAAVVMNRANNKQFPKTVCEVVYQKTGSTYQFSWVGQNKSTDVNKYAWEESMIVARKALSQSNVHEVIAKTNSMYYHNTSVDPKWKKRVVAKIGNHIFYTDSNKQ